MLLKPEISAVLYFRQLKLGYILVVWGIVCEKKKNSSSLRDLEQFPLLQTRRRQDPWNITCKFGLIHTDTYWSWAWTQMSHFLYSKVLWSGDSFSYWSCKLTSSLRRSWVRNWSWCRVVLMSMGTPSLWLSGDAWTQKARITDSFVGL